jgi:hypothetical protein
MNNIKEAFRFKVDLTDLSNCKVFAPDGSLVKDHLTSQQAFDLRYELYEKIVDRHNRLADKKRKKEVFSNCTQLNLFDNL